MVRNSRLSRNHVFFFFCQILTQFFFFFTKAGALENARKELKRISLDDASESQYGMIIFVFSSVGFF